MRIYVKTLYGKLFTLDLEGSNTVENVKAQFYDSQGISPNHQRLVCNGRELEEGCRTLAHYNVQNGSTILHFGTDVRCSDSVIHRNIAKGTTGNLTLNQMYGQWQTSSQVENDTLQDKQEELQHLQPKKQQLSGVELVRQGSGAESQSEQIGSQVEHDQLQLQQKQPDEDEQNQQPEQKSLQFSDKDQVQISEKNPVQRLEQDRFQHSESQNQYSYLQQLSNQQALAADQANNQIRENKRSDAIPFSMLIPVLLPRLDKERAMQLQTNFAKLRGNEVNKEGFLRFIKTIVGDQMLRREAHRIQIQLKRSRAARNSQTNSQQYQLKSQASSQQHTMPSCNVQQFTDAEAFSQVHSVLSAQQKKGHRSQHQPHILLENKDDTMTYNRMSEEFVNVKFCDFQIQLHGTCIDSFFSDDMKKAYLIYVVLAEGHCMPKYSGLSAKLVSAIISEVVDISKAIAESTVENSQSELVSFLKSIEGFEILGLNVGFLRERILHLQKIARQCDNVDDGDYAFVKEEVEETKSLLTSLTARCKKLRKTA